MRLPGVTRVEQARRVHQDNTDLDLVMWWEGSTQTGWHWPVGCREGLTKGIMVTVPLALALKPHNSGTFRLWHFPSCCPSSRAQGECLQVSDSVCSPFKGMFGFPIAFHLTWTGRIHADFHTQILWELLFLVLKPFLGSPSVGLGPSLCSATTPRCSANLFRVFTSLMI